ncbi:MAG: TIM barrel protein [Planctomycetaceae bacterium]|jgi:sugar phosphate isomerase/epimerase|nr:TIM barrel protein [Planctomycetaceae bacterium]
MAKRKSNTFTFPKLHNATWPGVVGKGGSDADPIIDLDTMLRLTTSAEVDGVKFDGFDLFLSTPHFDIDSSDDEIKKLVEKTQSLKLEIGTVVAPVWDGTGGGSAMGNETERKKFLTQVKKACRIASELRKLGVRPNGCIRIDTSASVEDWAKDPEGNQKLIADTFTEACKIAVDYDEVLACEGEICWGGIHSWRRMLQILEMVDRPQTLGFQADMSHTLLYLLGYNAPEDRLLPEKFDWNDKAVFDAAYRKMTNALRHWTVDLHIAQNDGTVFGSGDHDKTGRHCLAKDPNGKLDITYYAGFWLKDEDGLTKRFNHICWDGCMFPNSVMMNPQTWNDILAAMLNVRNEYGWK